MTKRLAAKSWLVALLPLFAAVACGGNDASTHQAPSSTASDGGAPAADASAEASEAGPQLPATTVTVRVGPFPVADVRVLLHDWAGAIIGDMTTDAKGSTSFRMAVSMVTVLVGAPPIGQAITYLEVEPGDRLDVAMAVDAAVTPTGTYSVDVPALPAGASNAVVRVGGSPCSRSVVDLAAPTQVAVSADCIHPKTAALAFATTAAAQRGTYAFKKGAGAPPASIALGPWAAPDKVLITAQNLPLDYSLRPPSLNVIADEAAFDSGAGFVNPGNQISFDIPAIASGFADAYETFTAVARGAVLEGNDVASIVRREPPNPLMVSDFADRPFVIDGVVTYTTARFGILLNSGGPIPTIDGGLVVIDWPLPQDASHRSTWTFVVPPWFKSVDLPELPEDIPSAFIPNAPKFRRHAVIDSDLTEGYAELRRRPLSPAVDEAVFGIDGRHTLRANGTERISWLGKGR